MLTPTSKVFLPVSGVALLLGAIYKTLTGDVLGGTLFLMVGAVAFVLGVMLSAFGVFWTGEGLGVPWPGEDLAIVAGMEAESTIAVVATPWYAARRCQTDSRRSARTSRDASNPRRRPHANASSARISGARSG